MIKGTECERSKRTMNRAPCFPIHSTDASMIRFAAVVLAALAMTFVLAIAGCATHASRLRMAPRSVSDKLGLAGCRVSVPLTEREVIQNAKLDGNPHPEDNYEWSRIVARKRPGDVLRQVSCDRPPYSYYYALIRKGAVRLKFHSIMN